MSEHGGGTPTYSIGAVARMVGLPVATLRSWEERYGVVIPSRSEGGQRLYSRDQLEQLRFLRGRIDDGMSPADAHRLLEQRAAAGADAPPTESRRRLVILLAERDPYAAELSEYFLRTEGYAVTVAFDAASAQAMVDADPPDLTVLEWLISGGAGAQLCHDLKARSDRPILVISSLPLGARAVEAGADAFLGKPLDPLQFVSTVKDLLGESALTRATAGATT
jgi:DNA-binding transcriptional MerR regulator